MDREGISELVRANAKMFGPRPALCQHGGMRSEEYSYQALDEASGKLAAALIAQGVQPDDRVALLCDSRPRWGVAFFATLRAGAVVMPLDPRQSVDDLAANLDDGAPRVLLTGEAQERLVSELLERCRGTIKVFSLEPDDANPSFPSVDSLLATDRNSCCIARDPGDAAVLTYTSGTTGSTKGVVTTHGNLLFQVRAFRQVMGNDADCTTVSILPLSHLFELTVGFLGVLYGGGCVCYCNSLLPVEIITAMQRHRVTCMAVVPLFLKLLETAIRNEIAKRGPVRRSACAALMKLSPFLPLAARRRLFSPVRSRFGGRLEYFISGGAPLDRGTLRFFRSIGLPVYQGYGLAEGSPVIATNVPRDDRPVSVGKPLPGVEVRISAEDGEILTRGPHIMRGYFRNAELSARMIDSDGWLHTGDLGRLDGDGYLYVTGRKKNTIVLGSGMKVQPEEVEDLLFEHPDIKEGCVIGLRAERGIFAGSEEVCAVAVASEGVIQRCAAAWPEIDDTIRRVIEQRSLRLTAFKRPTRIVLSRQALPRTTTRKVRRPVIQAWLSDKGARQ